MYWLLIGAVVLIVGALARSFIKPEPLRTAGASLGLAYRPPSPGRQALLQGNLNGLKIRIALLDTEPQEIKYCVHLYPHLDLDLRLARLENLEGLSEVAPSAREHPLGDEAFDARFLVNTSRPDAFSRMMTPNLKDRLLRVFDVCPGLVIEDHQMTVITDAEDLAPTTVVDTLDALVIVAVLLRVNRP
ncbi:MAG: hypothetical protein GY926_06005 [bacterium]|nr:hypothetical protein [bacterium]